MSERRDEFINIRVNRRKFRLILNIVLLIFIVCSVIAPWSTNIWWCIACERHPALGTFFNTLYFYAAAVVYAVLAGRRWNIPFIVYTALLVIGSAVALIAPESEPAGVFIFAVMPTVYGLWFIDLPVRVLYALDIVICAVPLVIMLRKYRKSAEKTA